MKKLFALLLALGMLCSFAMAEEAEAVELSWDSISDETKALGSLQQIEIPDVAKIVYWVPQNMAALDVNQIEAEVPPVAAFARCAFTRPTICSTSKRRGRPGTPKDFSAGETARHMVLLVRLSSATTRLVVSGFRPRSTHSTEA